MSLPPPPHGGARPGAGRKKSSEPKVRISVNITPDAANRLAAEARRLGTEDISRGIESAAANLPPTEIPYAPTRGRPRRIPD